MKNILVFAILVFFGAACQSTSREARTNKDVEIVERAINHLQNGKTEQAMSLVAPDAQMTVFGFGEFDGEEEIRGYFEWAKEMNMEFRYSSLYEASRLGPIWVEIHELEFKNDFMKSLSLYDGWFDVTDPSRVRVEDGKIQEIAFGPALSQGEELKADLRQPFTNWIKENRPDEFEQVFDGEQFVKTAEGARLFKEFYREFIVFRG